MNGSPQPQVGNDFNPEISSDIPVVKRPETSNAGAADQLSNPITAGGPQSVPVNDAEMDKVLEDVSGKVKAANADKPKKPGLLSRFKKKPKPAPVAEHKIEDTAQTAAPLNEQKPPKPDRKLPKNFLAAGAAVAVCLVLSVSAFSAFREEDKLASTQDQTASNQTQETTENKSVTPEDIDKLGSEIGSEVESLDETTDFDAESLTDSSLGL